MTPDARLDPPPGPLTRLVAWTAARLLPLPALPPPRSGEIRRVLVVRTDERVGNALLTIPLVRALQRALPEARIDLLLAARQARVADGLPNLSILRFDKRRPWRLPPRASYDLVIDAAHWHAFSLTSALVSRWASSRWVVGAARGPASLYTATVPPPPPGTPEAAAKVSLAAGLGLPALPAPPLETALGRRPLAFDLPPRFIALNPGARKPDHRWTEFAALARKLPLPAVILWGPGELDLASAIAAGSGAILAPRTDLDQLAGILRRAAVVVTNDTGPMHLAAACDAPVVGLFLEERGLRWAHPGPRFRAVLRPTVDSVLAAVRELLDTAGAAQEPAP